MLFDPTEEQLSIDGTVDDKRRDPAAGPDARQKRRCLPMAVRNVLDKSRSNKRASTRTSHVGFCPRFVEEHQLVREDSRLSPLPPFAFHYDIFAEPLCRYKNFFLTVSFIF